MKIVNQVRQSEDSPECDDGTQKAKQEYVLEVFLKILLFEVVSTREDHGWKQAIEEDLFVKVDIFDILRDVHDESEQKADDDPDASLMNEVYLNETMATCRCSRYFPMRM